MKLYEKEAIIQLDAENINESTQEKFFDIFVKRFDAEYPSSANKSTRIGSAEPS